MNGTESNVGRNLLAIALVVALILLAFFLGRASSPDSEVAPAEAPRSSTAHGDELTQPDVVAVATRFVQLTSEVSTGATEYRESLIALSTPSWRSEAAGMAKNTIAFIHDRYGEQATATYSPLRYRTTNCSARQCSVELWGVVVVSNSESTLEESWSTVTLKLERTGSDWLVAGQESEPGPTPTLMQGEAGAEPSELRGFKDLESDPSL